MKILLKIYGLSPGPFLPSYPVFVYSFFLPSAFERT